MPAPQRCAPQLDARGKGFAVETRSARTRSAVRSGATASIKDRRPETMGAEKLVPLETVRLSPTGTVLPLSMSASMPSSLGNWPPGALMVSVLPKLLYAAGYPFDAVAPTE